MRVSPSRSDGETKRMPGTEDEETAPGLFWAEVWESWPVFTSPQQSGAREAAQCCGEACCPQLRGIYYCLEGQTGSCLLACSLPWKEDQKEFWGVPGSTQFCQLPASLSVKNCLPMSPRI